MTTTERAMIAELKPCPFCGGSAIIEMDDSLGYWIQCDSCVVTGPTYRDEHIAVEHWNRRAEASKQSEKPDTAQDVPKKPDINKCPRCGGVADNGFDRCFPPNPYFCSKCEALPWDADALVAAAPAQPQAEVPGWAWRCAIENWWDMPPNGKPIKTGPALDWIEARAREIAAAQRGKNENT